MSSLLDSYLMFLSRNASAQKEGKVNLSLQSSQVLCLLSPYRYSVGFYEVIVNVSLNSHWLEKFSRLKPINLWSVKNAQ